MTELLQHQIGDIIGTGKTSSVHALSHDKVVKLFHESEPDYIPELELSILESISTTKLKTGQQFEMVKVQNRIGIIMDRIHGINTMKSLIRRPWKTAETGRKMARLHHEIHSIRVPDIVSQQEKLEQKIETSEDILKSRYDKILTYLKTLEFNDQLCHGDFHPKNIMNSEGRLTPLDWGDAHCGNAFGDVARTYIVLSSPHIPSGTPLLMKWMLKKYRKILVQSYISEYLKISNTKWQQIESWLIPVAAARIEEDISNEKEWLLNLIDNYLTNKR